MPWCCALKTKRIETTTESKGAPADTQNNFGFLCCAHNKKKLLPVNCIGSGPNSNDYGTNRILHHTIGLPDFSRSFVVFRRLLAIRYKSESIHC
ncbi:putative pyruvate decarboxylase [Helianthus anomalus]